jgi:hypothetical protein
MDDVHNSNNVKKEEQREKRMLPLSLTAPIMAPRPFNAVPHLKATVHGHRSMVMKGCLSSMWNLNRWIHPTIENSAGKIAQ